MDPLIIFHECLEIVLNSLSKSPLFSDWTVDNIANMDSAGSFEYHKEPVTLLTLLYKIYVLFNFNQLYLS